jgi:tetratricopeptide (TPR) repeat protein
MYTKCLNIKKAHYGDKNFNLATNYSNIGNVYADQGKLESALEMYTKCLNIKKAHYGEKNFNLATTYNNIGLVYDNQGKLE